MTRRVALPPLFVLLACSWISAQEFQSSSISADLKWVDLFTLKGEKHLIDDYSPRGPDGGIRVVVEIPTGTNAKWEVDKTDGSLKWEVQNGKPRIVKYLPYPGNYGLVPQTLHSSVLGGDGDPLDVLILGSSLPRGSIVEARLIGVLKLLDRGEQDDKLIAVLPHTPLANKISQEYWRSS